MAKKITDADNPAIETHDIKPEQIEQPPQESQSSKVDDDSPAPKPEKKEKVEKYAEDIPEHAEHILKSYPDYPKLYIDLHGGTFTVDTPPIFRSNATLYTNPYYSKPQKP